MQSNTPTSDTSQARPMSIFSPEAFPVKTSALLINKVKAQEESRESGLGSGQNMIVFWGKLDLVSSSLKTAQESLFLDSNTSYATLPDAGMMLNGDLFMLPNSDIPTLEKGFMVWPTPNAGDGKVWCNTADYYKKRYRIGKQDSLIAQCRLNGLTPNQTMNVYEWIMGFPKNWTATESTDAETL